MTENAGNATNHSLTTVDKASKEDEATEATPDALDQIRLGLLRLNS